MKTIFFCGALIAALALNAQQLPNATDYRQAVQVLNGGTLPTGRPPAKSSSRRNKAPDIRGTIDSSAIEVHREPPLPNNARLALALSENWLFSGPPPTAAAGGRVLYTYGQGVPTIVCAVLQVCELDLEAGETPSKEALDWGDHRFEVAMRNAGSGSQAFSYLVLKPTQPGLDTTMTIGTDRRPYYIRLVSTEHDHMARIGFSYPDEEEQRRRAELVARKAEEEHQRAEAERLAKLSAVRPIRNWNYRVQLHGKDARYLRPEKIGDDGIHTHIALSEEARHRGLPVVEISDARGPIPANARWAGNELIIDAVFARACLIEGVGRQQQRACITNKGLMLGSASDGSGN